MKWPKVTPRGARIELVSVTAAMGVAGWLLWGALGAVIGVVAGPVAALAIAGTYIGLTLPSSSDHMADHEPYLALREVRRSLPQWRVLARWWPGQFREPVALELLIEAEALLALGRRSQALVPAAEAVEIYQDLAISRPGKFQAGLAGALDRQARLLAAADNQAEAAAAAGLAARLYWNLAASAPGQYLPALAGSLTCQAAWLSEIGLDKAALEAAGVAAGICQDRLPRNDQPPSAGEALLLLGRLLAGEGRYREAAAPLARGWQLALSRDRQDLLAPAALALRAAYRADHAAVRDAWRGADGGEPPDWLTGLLVVELRRQLGGRAHPPRVGHELG